MKKQEKECYVRIQNAQIGYKKKILIKDLNIEIYKGDKILLLGANGTGKTTFIKVLLNLENLISGKIEHFYQSISFVPQNLEVPKEFLLTIEEVLELYLDLKFFDKNKQSKIKEIYNVLKKTNLLEKKDQLLKECSGGELQRVYIARALLKKPNFLILDEPLNAVDSDNQKQFFTLLQEIYKEYECTILMTSHILNETILNFFNRKFLIKELQLLEI